MTPTIALVPGFWEGIEPFGDVIHLLRKQGFPIMICPLVSTGTTSPGNPSMEDDIAAIRNPIEAAVMEGGDIVVVMHSAGGFLGSNAIEGLGAKARKEQGRTGGVVGLVFITGALFPEGFEHGDLPFGEVKVRLTPSIFFTWRTCDRCIADWLLTTYEGRGTALRRCKECLLQRC